MRPQGEQVAYRFVNHTVGHWDEWDNLISSHEEVYLLTYPILRMTRMGFWTRDINEKRFVRFWGKKALCHLSIEKAKESFVARKKRQIKLYSTRISSAQSALKQVDYLYK